MDSKCEEGGIGKNMEKWILHLSSDNPEKARKAIQVLRNKRAVEAIPEIFGALKKHGEEVEYECNEALEKIGEQGIPAMMEALEGKNMRMIACAAGVLGHLREKNAVPRLMELAKHRNRRVREEAVLALGNIGDRNALQVIVKALADPDQWVREIAGEAIHLFKEEEVFRAAIEVLGTGTERECRRAKKILESDPDASLGPLLEKYGEAIGREIKARRVSRKKGTRRRQLAKAREPK